MFLKNDISGLTYDGHGGGCCGIIHLSIFPTVETTIRQRVRWIKRAIRNAINSEYIAITSDTWHCAIEVVLIDSQLPGWREALEEVGFKIVFRFLNDNSGNFCNIFYLQTGEKP